MLKPNKGENFKAVIQLDVELAVEESPFLLQYNIFL